MAQPPATVATAERPRWIGALLAGLGAALGSGPAWGGLYDVSVWGPIAMVTMVLLIAVLIAVPGRPAALGACALLGITAFVLWSALSITWAEAPARAALETHRWALYAAILALAMLLIRTDSDRRLLLGSATAAGLIVVGVTVGRLLSGDGSSLFQAGRLAEPLGYVNGQAAAFAVLFWPLMAVAERHRRAAVRGAAAGTCCTLLGLVVLTQSRGAVLALMVSTVFVMATFPGRLRRGWLLVVIIVGVAAAGPTLTHVYTETPLDAARPQDRDVHRGALFLLLATVGVGVAWGFASLLCGTRAGAARDRRRWIVRGGSAVLAAVVVAMAVGLVAVIGDPVNRLGDQVDQFTNLSEDRTAGARFFAGGGNRYDYWRVAVREFRTEPFHGLGAGNYTRDYFRLRRTVEDVRQPHSLQLQTLAELGIVGCVLLLAGVGAMLIAAAPWAHRGKNGSGDAGIGVASGGLLVLWLTQTSVDWLHLLPSITGVAMCAAAILLPVRSGVERGWSWRVVVLLTGVILAVFAVAGIGRITLAAHLRAEARAALRADPAEAIRKATDSLRLQGSDLETMFTQAAGIARLGDYRGARATLVRAAQDQPSNFLPRALLGDLALRRGDRATAAREYAAASELNPRDQTLVTAARAAAARK